jgi:hypothetical protein
VGKIRQVQYVLDRAALGSTFLSHGRGLPEPSHNDQPVDGGYPLRKLPGTPLLEQFNRRYSLLHGREAAAFATPTIYG